MQNNNIFDQKFTLLTKDDQLVGFESVYVNQCSTLSDMIKSNESYKKNEPIPVNLTQVQLENFIRFIKYYKIEEYKNVKSTINKEELIKTADFMEYLTPVKFQSMLDSYFDDKLKLFVMHTDGPDQTELKYTDIKNLDKILDKILLTTYKQPIKLKLVSSKDKILLTIYHTQLQEYIQEYQRLSEKLHDKTFIKKQDKFSIGNNSVQISLDKNKNIYTIYTSLNSNILMLKCRYDRLKDIIDILLECCKWYDCILKKRAMPIYTGHMQPTKYAKCDESCSS